MQNPQSMDYKYSFTDDSTYVTVPQKLQCPMGILEFITNSHKYLCTFQLFIDATKITNFWSQQHNLFLECSKPQVHLCHYVLRPSFAMFIGSFPVAEVPWNEVISSSCIQSLCSNNQWSNRLHAT